MRLPKSLPDLHYIAVLMQTDGDKKIELKPGFYMEHDKDVSMIIVHLLILSYEVPPLQK